jgi:Mn-containing catalase
VWKDNEISAIDRKEARAAKLRHSAIVALLAKSFAEEANADMLLTPTARSLMNNA